MPGFYIGRYAYYPDEGLVRSLTSSDDVSDQNDSIRRYDNVLRRSLRQIFHQRCRGQIKKFLRSHHRSNADQPFVIEPILDQLEPILSWYFSKKDLGKLSLLWIAVLAGYHYSAELLVRSGADVNEPFGRHDPQVVRSHWTVLQLLLQMDPTPANESLIRLVVDHGADLEARDSDGQSFLHCAAMNGHVEMTKTLLERGADPFVKNNCGQNALHYLANSVKKVPLSKCAEVARVFIQKALSLEDRDRKERQPIHLALERRNHELIKLFLDHGSDANALLNGVPLLHLVIQAVRDFSQPKKLMETLLDHGASVDLRSAEGGTALHVVCAQLVARDRLPYVCFGISPSMSGMIELLVAAGADVLAENNSGETPFAWLSRGGQCHPDAMRTMIEVLAPRKVRQPTLELKDERIIERNQESRTHYQNCVEEVVRMKNESFIETCTLFDLLVKCRCKIAALMRNPEFEPKFASYDLSGFFIYGISLRRAFDRAQSLLHAMVEQEEMLDEAVYGALPYLVVRKVVQYGFGECYRCENQTGAN